MTKKKVIIFTITAFGFTLTLRRETGKKLGRPPAAAPRPLPPPGTPLPMEQE